MTEPDLKFAIDTLGPCTIPTPMSSTYFVGDDVRLLYHDRPGEVRSFLDAGREAPALELAGPRERIHFDPSRLKCGIVTCGGLCPGLNNVIRAVVLSLFHHYGVNNGARHSVTGTRA